MGYKPKPGYTYGQMLPYSRASEIVRRLKLKSQKEWKEWSKSGQRPSNVPGNPDKVYKDKGWVSYPEWMGYQANDSKAKSQQMLGFTAARVIVVKLKLRRVKEWNEWRKSGQRPSNVPSNPEKVYKDKGWVSWPDWMGYQYTHGDASRGKSQMLPYSRASEIVRQLKLKSQKEWTEWSKSGQRPSNVPSSPDKVYKDKGWVSYPEWMGYQANDSKAKSQQMLGFTAARVIVVKLKLRSVKEWYEWSKSGQRPSNVPSSPDKVYKDKGWVSWPDWMGYQYTMGDENNKRK
eukprot:g3452.t1